MRAALALGLVFALACPARAGVIRLDSVCPSVSKLQHPPGTRHLVIRCANGYTVTVANVYGPGTVCSAKRDAYGNVSITCA